MCNGWQSKPKKVFKIKILFTSKQQKGSRKGQKGFANDPIHHEDDF